uniref:Uncharacterized protein n=1 Tax=Anguilla anguilla TaxID=7936 RepID=A0A0E9V0E1_ANGAN
MHSPYECTLYGCFCCGILVCGCTCLNIYTLCCSGCV